MDLNATLLGQMITFALFAWFTMKFVWPPMMKALNERRQNIADGIAASERGKHELSLAQERAKEVLREARAEKNKILDMAQSRADKLVDEAKHIANKERKRILEAAEFETEQMKLQLKETLRKDVASVALTLAEKVLVKSVDDSSNKRLIDDLIATL